MKAHFIWKELAKLFKKTMPIYTEIKKTKDGYLLRFTYMRQKDKDLVMGVFEVELDQDFQERRAGFENS